MNTLQRKDRKFLATTDRATIDRRLRSNSIFFYIFLGLAFIQVASMIIITSLSASFNEASMSGPMEMLMVSNLLALSQPTDDDLQELEDQIADQVEEKLNAGSLDEENQTAPIDDYYTRRHIVDGRPPILIVGGSDGSGTRAFVDTLGRLGVPMLVDDGGTLDVHAGSMFQGQGWPPLVRLILESTHAANYTLESLPSHIRSQALAELEKFQEQYRERATNLVSKGKAENKRLATRIDFGFKAPISMLLLPLLLQIYGRIKFLHVVRDGRDVALSRNTSPVDKFYDSYFKNAKEKRAKYDKEGDESLKEVMAIQLWNDWNSQVLDWERRHTDCHSFDYLVMRTEDLLDPEKKFESLMQLSDFVGSQRTEEDICCLSRKAIVDMGQSGARRPQSFQEHGNSMGSDFMSRIRKQFGWGHGEEHDFPAFGDQKIGMDLSGLREEHEHLNLMMRKRPELFRRIQNARDHQQAEFKQRRERRYKMLAGRIQQQVNDGAAVMEKQQVQGEWRNGQFVSVRRRLFGEQFIPDALQGVFGDKKPDPLPEDFELVLEVPPPDKKRAFTTEDALKKIGDPKMRHKIQQMLLHKPGQGGAPREAPEEVKKRYGKWMSVLEERPELSTLLHLEGAESLHAFGYEPKSRFMDKADRLFQCDASVVCDD